MKKEKKILILCLSLVAMLLMIKMPTKADSGWDSDFDSGGLDSDSSWDSGSSWGYDDDYGYYSDGSGGGFGAVIFLVIIIIVAYAIVSSRKDQGNTASSSLPKTIVNPKDYTDMTKEEYNKIIPKTSMDEMKDIVFDLYKDIQYAWTNFDYDKLKLLLTDEIFNMYNSQLNTLEIKNQVNIMSQIEKEDVKIVSAKEENGVITIEAYLKVNTYDYVINKNTNEVLRGTHKYKMQYEYLITIVKDANSKEDKMVTCPNCGAQVEMTARGKCKYCDSVLVQKASDYVMSKKQSIGQKVLK